MNTDRIVDFLRFWLIDCLIDNELFDFSTFFVQSFKCANGPRPPVVSSGHSSRQLLTPMIVSVDARFCAMVSCVISGRWPRALISCAPTGNRSARGFLCFKWATISAVWFRWAVLIVVDSGWPEFWNGWFGCVRLFRFVLISYCVIWK